MSHLVFDTNILIDYLAGNIDALEAIDRCDHPVISKITYMEVMVGCKHSALVLGASPEGYEAALATAESMTRGWIYSTFSVLPIDELIADFSIEVRKQTLRKLPDTVIHATAILNGWDIVTRNSGDFRPLTKMPAGYKNVKVLVPYTLSAST